MKIFYAIQATGNGHISRAMELLPYLQQYGQVDVFLSGSNSHLKANLPVKFTSKGMSLFYGNKGGLDYFKMLQYCSPVRAYKEAKALPLEDYDIVLNDFESITAFSCYLKNIPSVNFGHQAAFISSHTPRPAKRSFAGEMVLKKYAPATGYVGLHFQPYDHFIYPPIIKSEILKGFSEDKGHITVYLSHYSDAVVANALSQLSDVRFEVFSKMVKQREQKGNITFIPIDNALFTKSMLQSHGVITGAGFETPAETLYLGKRLLCLPIRGQYEQLCNAAALQHFNVPIIEKIDEHFVENVQAWLNGLPQQQLTLMHDTFAIVQKVMETAQATKRLHQNTLSNILNEEDVWAIG
ncbi:MAG: glycosyl transferase [Sphingobacteriales bacterium]|uniref:glycosyltransferase family protein n=1 Tax=Hydrotalea flava TaxID=714549 RepID=UPI000830101F|nr:glycosyltransferase family protein [Hydrotalea flava]RTL56928.1 MAG: glycosyl transferase [Sphingobacteriales bacterium]